MKKIFLKLRMQVFVGVSVSLNFCYMQSACNRNYEIYICHIVSCGIAEVSRKKILHKF